VFLVADEGEQLTEIKSRDSATLGPTLRTAWYGETLGQANAEAARNRHVKAGSYSLGMLIGFQPDTVLPILREAHAGTPQRFVYCSAIDPGIPEDRPTFDTVDLIGTGELFLVDPDPITMDNGLKDDIWRHRVLRSKGEIRVPELDGHGYLTRAKLAALLMLLTEGGRTHVTPKDWELAAILWNTSCKVRDHYVRRGEIEDAKQEMARNRRFANREAMAEAARQQMRDSNDPVDRVRRSSPTTFTTANSRSPRSAMRADTRHSDRARYFDDALEYAAEQGWVEVPPKPWRHPL